MADVLDALWEQFEPTRPLAADQRDLYEDWQRELGPSDIKSKLTKAIARSRDASTYRLLTGHRGVGKTTELLRVADRLMSGQAPRKVFVSFVESEKWLDLNDVDAPDVVFQMVRQLVTDLKDQGFSFGWERFAGFFREFQEILNADVDLKTVKVPGPLEFGIALKEVAGVRSKMRKLLEGQLPTIYDLINREVLVKAKEWLRDQHGYEDIAIVVDELDRINRPEVQKQIFLERINVLRGLDCHVVYTIPIDFAYSLDNQRLRQQFEEVLTVPVIPVTRRNGEPLPEGLHALERIVERRAAEKEVSLEQFFESRSLLERICQLSGGHVRNLFILLRRSIARSETLTEHAVQRAARDEAVDLVRPLYAKHRRILDKLCQTRQPVEDDVTLWFELLRNHYVYAYEDEDGPWYDVNPLYHVLPAPSRSS